MDTGIHFREKKELTTSTCEPLAMKRLIPISSSNSRLKVSRCSLYRNGCNTTSENTVLCPKAKIIFFGLFNNQYHTIYSQENKKICSFLKKSISNEDVECLEGGKWKYLKDFLSETKIIILNGLIRPSFESLLVDEFLYHGKVVVSTHSEDLSLDNSYLNIINFVNFYEDIPSLVNNLLINPETIRNQSIQSTEFIKNQIQSSDLICEALVGLLRNIRSPH